MLVCAPTHLEQFTTSNCRQCNVCVSPKPHNATFAKIIARDGFRRKKAHQKLSASEPRLLGERDPLKIIGDMVFTPQDHCQTNLATFIARTFSHRLSSFLTKEQWLPTVIKNDIWRAAIISITIRPWEQLTDPGTLKWYAEHHETTQCKYIARRICFISVLGLMVVQFVQSNQTARKKKKKQRLCLGPCHKQENFTITRSKLLSKQKRQSVRHGTIQRKGSTDDHWRLETYTAFMCFQASWKARLCHGGVGFSTWPHNTNTRANDCWTTQSR